MKPTYITLKLVSLAGHLGDTAREIEATRGGELSFGQHLALTALRCVVSFVQRSFPIP